MLQKRKIEEILQDFKPATLEDVKGSKLMNRTDTKFAFSRELLPEILNGLHEDYFCMESGGKRIAGYQTLYFDTNKFHLYHKHHNGELNRFKVRHRTYLNSDLGFLEIKFKNNKGRTIKERIKEKSIELNVQNISGFLVERLPFEPSSLMPAVWVNYMRITLISRNSAERVTIDLDLEFIRNDERRRMNRLVIAEVKQCKKNPSAFLKRMKLKHIREGSLSKYCSAVALMCDGVKTNNFKENLILLKNIIDHDTAASIH